MYMQMQLEEQLHYSNTLPGHLSEWQWAVLVSITLITTSPSLLSPCKVLAGNLLAARLPDLMFVKRSPYLRELSELSHFETKAPKKQDPRGPRAEEEPLYKQFITLLRPVFQHPPSPFSFHCLHPYQNLLAPTLPSTTQVLRCLSAPANPKEQKARGCVMAYGYLTPASPLIRLSSLNDATCGGANATEKSIKAFH